MKLVSAIVTTCKREPETVARAVKSILAQTYSLIEIIVVDDSPDDYAYRERVRSEIEALSDSILYLCNEKQSGACFSRNRGLAAASGEYIAFLDDDDEWLPEKAEKLVGAFEKAEPQTAMIYCDFYQYNDESGTTRKIELRKLRGDIFDALMQHENFCGGTSMPMIRTESLREINGFDNELTAAQDYDTWLRLAERFPIDYYPEALTIYHWHPGEQITKNPRSRLMGLERICSKYEDYYCTHPIAYWSVLQELIPYYQTVGQTEKAKKTLKKVLLLCPLKLLNNSKIVIRYLQKEFSIRHSLITEGK